MLPQPELQKLNHAGSGGIYLLAISGNARASWTKWRKRRIPQSEGRTGPYTLKKQRLGLLGTYGALRSEIRAHCVAQHRKGPSYPSPCLLLGAELCLHNPRPSLDRDKWLGWRTRGVGAPATNRVGWRSSVSSEQMFARSERVQLGPFVRPRHNGVKAWSFCQHALRDSPGVKRSTRFVSPGAWFEKDMSLFIHRGNYDTWGGFSNTIMYGSIYFLTFSHISYYSMVFIFLFYSYQRVWGQKSERKQNIIPSICESYYSHL